MVSIRKGCASSFIAFVNLFSYLCFFIVAPVSAYGQVSAHAVGPSATKFVPPFAVKLYFIRKGDNIDTIAKRYNISAAGLRQLNSGQNINMFGPIAEGTSIIVPAQPLSAHSSAIFMAQARSTDMQRWIAQIGRQAVNKQDFTEFARQELAARSAQAISNWLNQYGTARVRASFAAPMSITAADMQFLFPLYEREASMVFTQMGIHNIDKYWQGNVGIGTRYFMPHSMVGANMFYDYDISRGHSRIGIGAEFWRDYIRFHANSYLGISAWKQSTAHEEYFERAAKGFDIGMQAFLPFYPHISFKVGYDRYFGQILPEKKKFSESALVTDPQNVNIGISYTPVPMVSFNVDHKQAIGGYGVTKIGAQVTYRFGVPFADQIDSQAVSQLRTVMGGRYDFVERNNNIILEYKRGPFTPPPPKPHQETIVASFAKTEFAIIAATQTPVSIGLRIVNEHGQPVNVSVSDISFAFSPDQNSPKVTKIAPIGPGRYSVDIVAGAADRRAFTITPIVKGQRGKSSIIHIIESVPEDVQYDFSVENRVIYVKNHPAINDKAVAIFRIKHVDSKTGKSYPIFGLEKDLSVNVTMINKGRAIKAANGQGLVFGSVIADRSISDKAQYRSVGQSDIAGRYSVSISYRGKAFKVTPIIVEVFDPAARIDKTSSSFRVMPHAIAADGRDSSVVKFKASDKNGNPITFTPFIAANNLSEAVTFRIYDDQGHIVHAPDVTIEPTVFDKASGEYRTKIRSTKPGHYRIRPVILGIEEVEFEEAIVVSQEKKKVTHAYFVHREIGIMKGADKAVDIVLEITDKNNNPIDVAMEDIAIRVNPQNSVMQMSGFRRVSRGHYEMSINGAQASKGDVTITPIVEGVEGTAITVHILDAASDIGVDISAQPTAIYTVNPDSVNDQVEVSINVKAVREADISYPVFGFDTIASTMEIRAKAMAQANADNARQAKQPLHFDPIKVVSSTKNHATYRAVGRSDLAGSYEVAAYYNDKQISNNKVTIVVTTPQKTIDKTRSSFSVTPPTIKANNKERAQISFSPKDANGQAVFNRASVNGKEVVTFHVLDQAGQEVAPPDVIIDNREFDPSGRFTASIHGVKPGRYSVVPYIMGIISTDFAQTIELTDPNKKPEIYRSSFDKPEFGIIQGSSEVVTLNMQVQDGENKPFDPKKEDIYFKIRPANMPVSVAVARQIEPGAYEVQFSANRAPAGEVSVSPVIKGQEGKATKVHIWTAIPDNASYQVTVAPPEIYTKNPADIKDKTTARITISYEHVKSGASYPIFGFASITEGLKFVAERPANFAAFPDVSPPTRGLSFDKVRQISANDKEVTYEAIGQSQIPGTFKVYAYYKDTKLDAASGQVTVIEPNRNIDKTTSSFKVMPHAIAADGRDSSVVKFKASDKNGNPITFTPFIAANNLSEAVTFRIYDDQGHIVHAPDVTIEPTVFDKASGEYRTKIRSTKPGHYRIRPVILGIEEVEFEEAIVVSQEKKKVTHAYFVHREIGIMKGADKAVDIVLEITDKNNNPIDVAMEDIAIRVNPQNSVMQMSGFRRVSRGHYEMSINGAQASKGDVTITPIVEGVEGTAITVHILDAASDIGVDISAQPTAIYTVNPDSVNDQVEVSINVKAVREADISYPVFGFDTIASTMEIRAKAMAQANADNARQAKQPLHFDPIKVVSSTKNHATYRAVGRSDLAGSYEVAAYYNDKQISNNKVTIVVTTPQKTIDKTRSSFSVTPPTIKANNKERAQISFSPKDANGQAVFNRASVNGKEVVTFHVLDQAGQEVAPPDVIIDNREFDPSGRFTASIHGVKPGRYSVVPYITGVASTDFAQTIEFTDPNKKTEIYRSSFDKPEFGIIQGSSEVVTLNMRVQDGKNKPFDPNEEDIHFKIRPDNIPVSVDVVQQIEPGEYEVQFSANGAPAGDVLVSPVIKGQEGKATKVHIWPAIPDNASYQVTVAPPEIYTKNPADIKDKTTIRITISYEHVKSGASYPIFGFASITKGLKFVAERPANFAAFPDVSPPTRGLSFDKARQISANDKEVTYEAIGQSQIPGTFKVYAYYKDTKLDAASGEVTVIEPNRNIDENNSRFTIRPSYIVHDGQDQAQAVLKIRASDGQPVFSSDISKMPGFISFVVYDKEGNVVSAPGVTIEYTGYNEGDDSFEAKIYGTKDGHYIVRPIILGKAYTHLEAPITLGAPYPIISMPPVVGIVTGSNSVRIEAVVRDREGEYLDVRPDEIKYEMQGDTGYFTIVNSEQPFKYDAPGHYSMEIKAQPHNGDKREITITPFLRGERGLPMKVINYGYLPDALVSKVEVVPDNLYVDGSGYSPTEFHYLLTIKDMATSKEGFPIFAYGDLTNKLSFKLTARYSDLDTPFYVTLGRVTSSERAPTGERTYEVTGRSTEAGTLIGFMIFNSLPIAASAHPIKFWPAPSSADVTFDALTPSIIPAASDNAQSDRGALAAITVKDSRTGHLLSKEQYNEMAADRPYNIEVIDEQERRVATQNFQVRYSGINPATGQEKAYIAIKNPGNYQVKLTMAGRVIAAYPLKVTKPHKAFGFTPSETTVVSGDVTQAVAQFAINIVDEEGQPVEIDKDKAFDYSIDPANAPVEVSQLFEKRVGSYFLNVKAVPVSHPTDVMITPIINNHPGAPATIHIMPASQDMIIANIDADLTVQTSTSDKVIYTQNSDIDATNAILYFRAREKQADGTFRPFRASPASIIFMAMKEDGTKTDDMATIGPVQTAPDEGTRAVYYAIVKSKNNPGRLNFKVNYNQQSFNTPPASVIIKEQRSTFSEANSSFSINPTTIYAGSERASDIDIKIRDDMGHNYIGETFKRDPSIMKLAAFDKNNMPAKDAVSFAAITQEGDKFVSSVTGVKAGNYKITLSLKGTQIFSQNIKVVANLEQIDPQNSSFTIDRASIDADDRDSANITIKAKDKSGNSISNYDNVVDFSITDEEGRSVTRPDITITRNMNAQASENTTPAQTAYEATITGRRAGRYQIVAYVKGVKIAAREISVSADNNKVDSEQSEIYMDSRSVQADDISKVGVYFIMRDKFGNIINKEEAGPNPQYVSFEIFNQDGIKVADDAVTISEMSKTAQKGTYRAQIKAKEEGTYIIKPKIQGKIVDKEAKFSVIPPTPISKTDSSFTIDEQVMSIDSSKTYSASKTTKMRLKLSGENDKPVAVNINDVSFDIIDMERKEKASKNDIEVRNIAFASGPKARSKVARNADSIIADLTVRQGGNYKITPKIGDKSYDNLARNVKVTNNTPPDESQSDFTIEKTGGRDSSGKQGFRAIFEPRGKEGDPIRAMDSDKLSIKAVDKRGTPYSDDEIEIGKARPRDDGSYEIPFTIRDVKNQSRAFPVFDGEEYRSLHSPIGGEPEQPQRLSQKYSYIKVSPHEVANAKDSEAIASFYARDEDDKPMEVIDEKDIEFSIHKESGIFQSGKIKIGKAYKANDGSGRYEAIISVPSFTLTGNYKIRVTYNGKKLFGEVSDKNGSFRVSSAGLAIDPLKSKWQVKPKEIKADGQTEVTFQLTARSVFNNPVKTLNESLFTINVYKKGEDKPSNAVSVSSIAEDSEAGIYSFNIKTVAAGTYEVKVNYLGLPILITNSSSDALEFSAR